VLALTHDLLWPRLAGWHLLSLPPSLSLSIPPSIPPSSGMNPNLSVHPQLRGTVQPAAGFNDDGDAQVLRKAMKGLGKWGPCTQPLPAAPQQLLGQKTHPGARREGEKSQLWSPGSSLFPISHLRGGNDVPAVRGDMVWLCWPPQLSPASLLSFQARTKGPSSTW